MLQAQEQYMESPKPRTFVERIKKSDGSAIHLIKTYDETNEACWFLLKANERSLVRLERTSFDDIIDLNEYGEVVASGWGHNPDMEFLAKLNGEA